MGVAGEVDGADVVDGAASGLERRSGPRMEKEVAPLVLILN